MALTRGVYNTRINYFKIGINFVCTQIFEAKNRPSDNPLIVHVSSVDMLKTFVEEITPTVSFLIVGGDNGPVEFTWEICCG